MIAHNRVTLWSLNRLMEIDREAEYHTRNKSAIHCYANGINPFQWPRAPTAQQGHQSTAAIPVVKTPQDPLKPFTLLAQSPESTQPPLCNLGIFALLLLALLLAVLMLSVNHTSGTTGEGMLND